MARAAGPIRSQFRSTLWVTSSTANVAMPAASPERRMSGMPTRNAYSPPTTAAMTSVRAFPTCAPAIHGKRSGLTADSFSSSGSEVSAAANPPTATKLMCPNDRTPELPANT